MADIADLKSRYFVQPADANPPSEPVPATFSGCKVTPLIDAAQYFAEIDASLGLVGTGPDAASNSGHFIFIANWWLGLSGGDYIAADRFPSAFGPKVVNESPFLLDGPGGSNELRNILKDKARKGVDVRVLGWVSGALMSSAAAQANGAKHIARCNSLTMQSIKDLRPPHTVGVKAILNLIAHTAGAVHSKLFLVGTKEWAIGFTGGIDFVMNRWDEPSHQGDEPWHDATAKVEGPAVQAFYDWFRNMWNENAVRRATRFRFEGDEIRSVLPGETELPPHTLPTTPVGKHHVQSLRTVSPFRYKFSNLLPARPALRFAPQGLFEFKSAMKKALTNAQTYIYIEDQFFWSQEILSWVNKAIKAPRSALRVILLMPGDADPNDPVTPIALLSNSINHGLLEGLTPAQRNQVRMFRRMSKVAVEGRPFNITNVQVDGTTSRATTDLPAPRAFAANELARARPIIRKEGVEFRVVGNLAVAKGDLAVLVVENLPTAPTVGVYQMFRLRGVIVHSKTTLVDDHWAIIGSANIARRSLYTDLEHCVSILDEDDLVVKEYRKTLWADHFRHANPEDFDDIQAALHAWESTWGTPGASPPRPVSLEPIALPITPDVPLRGAIKEHYDMWGDVDARDEWGGLCP